jgi:serine/threonine protein kinase
MVSFNVQVFRAVHISTNQEVAIKDISQEKLTLKLQENLESEISILKNHVHRNIVKLYDIEVSHVAHALGLDGRT